jgi:enoyl-CoA hydratase/carnithine racemase
MFCAGADLKERNGLTTPQVEDLVLGLRTTFHLWYHLPQPTIALLSGAALGGGLELALASDIRVASKDAILGLPETSLAIIPGAVSIGHLPEGRHPASATCNRSCSR